MNSRLGTAQEVRATYVEGSHFPSRETKAQSLPWYDVVTRRWVRRGEGGCDTNNNNNNNDTEGDTAAEPPQSQPPPENGANHAKRQQTLYNAWR
jgi:hypothetical protein